MEIYPDRIMAAGRLRTSSGTGILVVEEILGTRGGHVPPQPANILFDRPGEAGLRPVVPDGREPSVLRRRKRRSAKEPELPRPLERVVVLSLTSPVFSPSIPIDGLGGMVGDMEAVAQELCVRGSGSPQGIVAIDSVDYPKHDRPVPRRSPKNR
jgi:hypothetical protein